MHIVHWGKYYPPRMGGIESVTRILAEGHAAAGHSVEVVCFHKAATATTQVGRVRVIRCRERVGAASQPLGWDYWRLGLRHARGADVVHLHGPNLLASLMTLRLAKAVRLVVHWHSDIVGKGWLGRLLRPLEQRMLSRADAIVCTSPPYAEHSASLRKWRHKLCSVPIGIEDPGPSAAPAALPARVEEFLAGRRHVFAIGRLVPYKGFAHLVDAARRFPPDLAVVIGGNGPLREVLQDRATAAGVADRVLFTGGLSDAELDALMRRAMAFCLPSVARSEAFGVVLLEAMARGVPVVATRISGSGVPWVNRDGDSGLNVEPGDSQALADACTKIAANPALRERFAQGARRNFERRFTAEVFAKTMLNVYQQGVLGVEH